MPFKIVQTCEKGQERLTVCPSGWEYYGVLYWPRKKVNKLIKFEDSMPKPNWSLTKCVVKKQNIPNYDNAEKELQNMLGYSHTTLPTVLGAKQMEVDPNNTADQKVILENIQTIINNQKILMENQKQLMKAITEMSEKLDIITTDMTPLQELTTFNRTENKFLENSVFSLKPIENLTQLSHLENILQDDDKKTQYIEKYRIVCGLGKALNCAYKLSDLFFTREFLTQCSWSGGSRGEGTKISIKNYKNILNLFFCIVHECDESYTVAQNEGFFKTILRNSLRRHLSKQQRISTCKNRKKMPKLMATQDNTNEDMPILNEENTLSETDVPNELIVPIIEHLN